MASDITLSSAVRNNLLSLQNTAQLLGRTQERLATGLKVNSALDDPTAFFTASALNSRASDLNRLLDSVGNALQTIRAADNGIEAITALVESAQASARQALQSPGPVSTTAAAATTTGGVLFAANDTAATLTGSVALSADTAATLTGTAITADTAAVGTGSAIGAQTQELDGDGISLADGETFTISDGTNSVTFEVDYDGSGVGVGNIQIGDANQTIQGLITEIGTELTNAGVTATVTNAGTTAAVQLEVESTNVANDITVSTSNASVLATLGLDAIGTGTTTSRTIAPTNATVGALDGTLSIQVGSSTALTLDLSNYDNRRDLGAALTGLTGGTLSLNGSGQIAVSATANTDDIVIGVSGGSDDAGALQDLGIGNGTQTSRTVEPTNTTTGLAAAISGNETLVFTNGSNTATITFGTNDASNQVSNRSELAAQLSALSGANFSLSISSNNVTASAPSVAAGAISVAGGTNALSFAGFTGGQSASATNAALAGLSQNDFTVNFDGAGAQTIDFSAIDSVEDLDAALATLTGGTATRTASGAIQFTGSSTTGSVAIGGTVTGTGFTAGTTNATAASTTNNIDRAALETEFNNLRNQIDQLASDASFNGVNLLDGNSLSVIFNEDGSSSLSITGVTFDAAGLGIAAASTDAFQSDVSINASLDELDSAIATLRQQSSTFGSNLSVVEIRQDFTKNLVNTLETGAANLTLADANEEGANVLALQTRQQLSSVALSLASQADQNVLRLF